MYNFKTRTGTIVISICKISIGDFNNNWFNESKRLPLYNLFVKDNKYRQLVSCRSTDSKTCIDHLYTNLTDTQISTNKLETYLITVAKRI